MTASRPHDHVSQAQAGRAVPAPPARLAVTRAALCLIALAGLATMACTGSSDSSGAGDLRAQRVVLEREVEGLRAVVQRLERGQPLLPADDIAVAIDEAFVRDLVLAQLPFDADVDRFHVHLASVDVQFRGSPTLQLHGRIQVRDRPDVTAAISLFGALDDLRIDRERTMLHATLAADHLTITEATGLAQYLSGETLDELARRVRIETGRQLPAVRFPVAVQQAIDLPAVSEGVVRLAAARLPLAASISQVVAARGRLWISVHVAPGAFGAPAAQGAR
jgi:hypothetical protein